MHLPLPIFGVICKKQHQPLADLKNIITFAILNMVSVVQLVERQIVVLVVVGSSPTVHPPKSRLLSEVCFFVSAHVELHEF